MNYTFEGTVLSNDGTVQFSITGLIRTFKVVKSMKFKTDSYIPEYQLIVDIPTDYHELIISKKFTINIMIKLNDLTMNVNLTPKKISSYQYNETTDTITFNMFLFNSVLFRLIHENNLSFFYTYNKFGGVNEQGFFNKNYYNFFTDVLINDGFSQLYGEPSFYNYIDLDKINNTSIEAINLPNYSNYDLLKYYLSEYYPILDEPLFIIDDFFVPKTSNDNKGIKIILTSFNSIKNQSFNVFSVDARINSIFPIKELEVIQDFNNFEFYKKSVANYILNNFNVPQIILHDEKINLKKYNGKDLTTISSNSPYYIDVNTINTVASIMKLKENYKEIITKDLKTHIIYQRAYILGSFDVGDSLDYKNLKFFNYASEITFTPISKITDNQFKAEALHKVINLY